MSRRRRRLVAVLVAPLALYAVLLAVGSALFAHGDYQIPAELEAPDIVEPSRPPGLRLRYTGVAGYEVTDGETVVLLDPVITRPTIFDLATGPVEVDEAQVQRTFPRADFILVNHAHHDHGVDAPSIARRTGATLVGSPSMINFARAQGVAEAQLRVVRGGERLRLGSFEVQVALGDHAPLLGTKWLMRGTISPDTEGPLWFFEYAQDAAFAFHLDSPRGRLLFHPQSGYIGGELPPAEVAIFGIAGYPFDAEKLRALRDQTRARFVLPTHFDNFFQPRSRGLAWLPVVDEDGLYEAVAQVQGPRVFLLEYDRWVTFPGP